MQSYVTSTGIMIQASCFLLAAFFVFLYRRKRQGYLLAWSAAWLLVALHFLFSALGVWLHGDQKWLGWLGALNEAVFAFAGLAFYCASRLYASLKVPKWVGAAGLIAIIWSIAHARYSVGVPAVVLGVGLIFLLVAHTFWHEGRKQEARADVLLGFTFAGWGLLCISTLLHSRFAFLQKLHLLPAIILPQLFACVLMVMSVYEEERRRAERNMLALSNLNLVTGSFVGGEIQKMLGQALDRVLSVVRVPAGALCLQQGETSGTASVIVAGLDDSFSTAIQESKLNEYFINLVARLGGLVVFRDLGRDTSWKALEKDDAFRRIRQLLLNEGLRTIVGISLQAKERVFGVLLLGTPDNRSFGPAERRLLLALGQQIGMAVENSYLIRQTSRRTEELHILNEIGRALSSTLDLDKLLERIYSEMRRVVDAGSFFIAYHDQDTGEVRFELEVVDGKRLPKRSRAIANRLVEYVVRTEQPLLIRERYSEEAERLGFESRLVGSICAVPLILYDRPVGVMAVHSQKERVFDEGHVEFLRVLGSEAGIAIENARLFAEEQKKSRQLTLINNISNHAITTLDPEEMLGKIAGEMEKHLSYNHIGIAILDYSAKELVVQADAGLRREAVGRRLLLGEGLIGQVARTGQMAIVREANASTPRMVLPDSAASVALPVTY
ncbi:MAG TPA: GAF domain-containing protein, partial [Candidatus Acidoferrales bacterium]|nr:GAF domain-containing protein [Candidatus Acidoferrales bacterium]